jgi:hypothetical protein
MPTGGGSVCWLPAITPSCRAGATAASSLNTTPTLTAHLIENTFASLKSARRISTRYDHTATAFAAFVSLACVFHWLR